MLLMIDNYDSFTYNLVQYLAELGGKVANKLGIGDMDTMLVKGTTKVAQDAVNKSQKSVIRKAFEGALSEANDSIINQWHIYV